MIEWWKYVIVIVVSYFLGNINFARILSKFKKTDITKQGSGNPGTMNMLRTFGIGLGVLTLVLDAGKGVLSALLGFLLFGGDYSSATAMTGLYIGGLSVVIGHNFPVIYKFKGGKGVACIIGMFLVASPIWVAGSFVFAFIIYLFIFDYAAVASFIFITILTFVEAQKFTGEFWISFLLYCLYFMTVYAHRSNIHRLLLGKENKVNFRKALKKLYTRKEIKAEKKEIKTELKNDKHEEIG